MSAATPCARCGAPQAASSPAPFDAPPPSGPPQFLPPPPQYLPPPQFAPPQFAPPQQYLPPPPQFPGAAFPVAPPVPPKRTGRIVGIVLFAALLLVAAGVGALVLLGTDDEAATARPSADAWVSVTSASGRFRLDMPSDPESHSQGIPGGSGASFEVLVALDPDDPAGQSGLMFMEGDLSSLGGSPDQLAAGFDSTLAGMANGAIAGQGGTVTDTARVDSAIGPAGTFRGTIEERGFSIVGFMVLHESTIGVVFTVVPTGEEAQGQQSVDRAVESLEAL